MTKLHETIGDINKLVIISNRNPSIEEVVLSLVAYKVCTYDLGQDMKTKFKTTQGVLLSMQRTHFLSRFYLGFY